ncbi:hypothetical protein AAVH_40843 [Aphelenchoides avenae]|nr:hypothetical protein AAVH_40843 [Aphelenchus avenae]
MKCSDVRVGRPVLPTEDSRDFDADVVKWLIFDVFERVDEVKKTSYRDTITEDPDFCHECETRRIRIV